MVIDRTRALDQVRPSQMHNRQHTVDNMVDGLRAAALFPIGIFLFGKQIARIRKSRHPNAIFKPRIPADMIDMQMRAHHIIDLFNRNAGLGERRHIMVVGFLVPAWTVGTVFVIAQTAIHQNRVMRGFDHIGLEA